MKKHNRKPLFPSLTSISITTLLFVPFLVLIISILSVFPANAQKKAAATQTFSKDNLLAWCVVPFDKEKREPAERAKMLKELGITKLAYDWRTEHLEDLEEEIKVLRENNIALASVWFWVDSDSLFSFNNQRMLDILERNNVKTELWMSFHDPYFEGLSDSEKLDKAVKAVGEIHQKAQSIGCKVGLYNHGSWFGEPLNQIKIIEALDRDGIGMVYNFHHAHHQIDHFSTLLPKMQPHLYAINLNGMKKEGDKILPLGKGDAEQKMIAEIRASGYNGPIGIIGHVNDEDIKVVLERNLDGLQAILKDMGEKKALKTY